MASLLFVHGTGVRGPAFDASFALIKAQADEHLPGVDVQACLWGDELGADRPDDAAAVPGPPRERPAPTPPDERSRELRWSLLYDDPLYELRTFAALAAASGDDDGLGADDVTPAERARADQWLSPLRDLQPSHGGIARAGHLAVRLIAPTLEQLQQGDTLVMALRASALATTERQRPMLARAAVGAWMNAAAASGLPALDGELRDILYQDIVARLGGATRGIKDELLGALGGLASRVATPILRWKRNDISDASHAAIHDILLYQTPHGGERIRGLIRSRIAACRKNAPVHVLAHSLGGIASVELLAGAEDLQVQRLITCGSQAPFLYEADSLSTLRRDRALPAHFPRWLNVYDRNDMLSYAAAGVFADARIQDHEVASRQPFPQSHSAYWVQTGLWKRLKAFLQ